MPTETIGTNHDATVKSWTARVFTEYLRGSLLEPLMGTEDKSVIQILPEVETMDGDEFNFHFRAQIDRTTGVQGSTTLKGKEQDLTIYVDKVTVDENANAVTVRNKDISQQRTKVNLKENQFNLC